MITYATCSTILAALSAASGGDTIVLSGNCGPLTVSQKYASQVTIDATDASITGLRLTGSNIAWHGGTVTAEHGLTGYATKGYAAYVTGQNITLSSVTFTTGRMGMVAANATNLAVRDSRFTGLRSDGINIQLTNGFQVTNTRFENSLPNPTSCTYADGTVTYGLKLSACSGVWVDGDHPDAVQMRNGVVNAVLEQNTVTGKTQGLAQMDTTGDAPLQNVRIANNTVAVDFSHAITLYTCGGCKIDGNQVTRGAASIYKAVIRPGDALRCSNFAQDEKVQDAVCTIA